MDKTAGDLGHYLWDGSKDRGFLQGAVGWVQGQGIPAGRQGGQRDGGAELVHGGGGGQGTQQGQEALADVGDKVYDDDLNCLFLVQH